MQEVMRITSSGLLRYLDQTTRAACLFLCSETSAMCRAVLLHEMVLTEQQARGLYLSPVLLDCKGALTLHIYAYSFGVSPATIDMLHGLVVALPSSHLHLYIHRAFMLPRIWYERSLEPLLHFLTKVYLLFKRKVRVFLDRERAMPSLCICVEGTLDTAHSPSTETQQVIQNLLNAVFTPQATVILTQEFIYLYFDCDRAPFSVSWHCLRDALRLHRSKHTYGRTAHRSFAQETTTRQLAY